MKLIKSKKTGNYSVRYLTSEGKYTNQSLGTTNKEMAGRLVKEAKIEELEMLAKAGAIQRDAITSIIAGKKISIDGMLDEWRGYKKNLSHSANTIYTQEANIRHFIICSRLEGKSIGDVTARHVKEWLELDDSVSLSQRNQRHSSLRSFFEFGIAAGYTLKDPTRLVAVDKSKLTHSQKEPRKKTAFTAREFNKIMKHAPYFYRQAIALCWWTGLRISDVANLEWDSWGDNTLTVHCEKTDKRVCLPLEHPLVGGGELRKTLTEIECSHTLYCFPEQRKINQEPKKRSTLCVYLRRIMENLNMWEKGKGWHSLRRSFISRCKREGMELKDIAVWVGHSNSATTEVYVVDEEPKIKAGGRL